LWQEQAELQELVPSKPWFQSFWKEWDDGKIYDQQEKIPEDSIGDADVVIQGAKTDISRFAQGRQSIQQRRSTDAADPHGVSCMKR
jgi:hypothetical protein